MHDISPRSLPRWAALAADIKRCGQALGFQAVGISDASPDGAEARLSTWLEKGFHGDMDYMAKHGSKRCRPAELVPGTLRVITVRMDYHPARARDSQEVLGDRGKAFISRYALGRDYHKVVRNRLQRLADHIRDAAGPAACRVFSDSAPVMEVELAQRSGIGWRGKHTLLLTRGHGSWFFLGEIYTDLPLPADAPAGNHCGTCRSCIDACPTGAIVAPYELDARRCISYLTIEHRDAIPPELRPSMGNRIYGCDDCQFTCPWNRFARPSEEADFRVRQGLDDADLVELFSWSEDAFQHRFAGSPIRRIGHQRWLRNLAVALGNAPATPARAAALAHRLDHPSPLVREHVAWAMARHESRRLP